VDRLAFAGFGQRLCSLLHGLSGGSGWQDEGAVSQHGGIVSKEAKGRWEENWPEFSELLKARLRKGYQEYTDASFARSPEELICELQAEALDYAGWGLVFWVRMKSALGHLEDLRNEFAGLQQARDKVCEDVDRLEKYRKKLSNEVSVLERR